MSHQNDDSGYPALNLKTACYSGALKFSRIFDGRQGHFFTIVSPLFYLLPFLRLH